MNIKKISLFVSDAVSDRMLIETQLRKSSYEINLKKGVSHTYKNNKIL